MGVYTDFPLVDLDHLVAGSTAQESQGRHPVQLPACPTGHTGGIWDRVVAHLDHCDGSHSGGLSSSDHMSDLGLPHSLVLYMFDNDPVSRFSNPECMSWRSRKSSRDDEEGQGGEL